MTTTLPCPVCGATLSPDVSTCPQCHTDFSQTTIGFGDSPTIVCLRAAEPVDSHALIEDLVATLTPRFQVVRRLGQGGMGTVYLGWDPLLRRNVAIKVLTPDFAADESAKARFIREAQAAAAVAHPNVVSIFQVGELQKTGAPYFVMQFIDGQTLDAAFPRGKPAAQSPAKRIIGEVAAALGAAHARGLVHRDIKPSNIMLDAESGRAMVLDFGISASTQAQPHAVEKLTATGIYIGTPRYMSPEQASGQDATDRSDVYSLGCVAFELLSGRPVFEEQSVLGLLAAHIKERPKEIGSLRLDLDADFAALIDQCLRKAGDARPSAPQVAKALGVSEPPKAEWPPPGLEAFQANARRVWNGLLAGAAAALLLLCILASQPNLLVNEGATNHASFSSGGAWRDVLWGFGGTSSRLSEWELSPGFGGSASRLVMWEFGATIALIIYAAFGAVATIMFLPAARDWWRGRLSGYSTPTLWRVLLTSGSTDRDKGGWLAGSATENAHEIGGTRLLARALVFSALLLTIFVPVAWSLGLLGFDRDESWFVLSSKELWLTLLPLCALLLIAFVLSVGSMRSWLRRIPRHWQLVSTQRFATTHPEVVAAWHDRSGTKSATPKAVNSMLQIVAIGATMLLAITVSVSVLTTVLPYARHPATDSRDYPATTDVFSPEKQLYGLIGSWSDVTAPRAVDPRVWKAVAGLQAIVQTGREASGAGLRALGVADSDVTTNWGSDSQAERDRILMRLPWTGPPDSAARSVLLRAVHPAWLAFARRLADSGTPSRWWSTDSTEMLSEKLRFSWALDLLDGVFGSLLSSVRLELADGRAPQARADLERAARLLLVMRRDAVNGRGLESNPGALGLLSNPGYFASPFAMALGQLAAVEGRRDESVLARRMLSLIGRIDQSIAMHLVYGDALDKVSFALLDPSGRSLESLVRDTSVTLDVRAYAVTHFADAFCVSPREILLGIGTVRLRAVERAASLLEAQGYDGPWTTAARTHASWLHASWLGSGGSSGRLEFKSDSAKMYPIAWGELLVSTSLLNRAWNCRYFQLE